MIKKQLLLIGLIVTQQAFSMNPDIHFNQAIKYSAIGICALAAGITTGIFLKKQLKKEKKDHIKILSYALATTGAAVGTTACAILAIKNIIYGTSAQFDQIADNAFNRGHVHINGILEENRALVGELNQAAAQVGNAAERIDHVINNAAAHAAEAREFINPAVQVAGGAANVVAQGAHVAAQGARAGANGARAGWRRVAGFFGNIANIGIPDDAAEELAREAAAAAAAPAH